MPIQADMHHPSWLRASPLCVKSHLFGLGSELPNPRATSELAKEKPCLSRAF